MNPISLRNFNAIYRDVVDEVLAQWTPAMQKTVGDFDIERYLRVSAARFYHAYRSCSGSARAVCDVGGSFGAFPLTLLKIGFDVVTVRTIQYGGDAFDALSNYIAGRGVGILDYDPFIENAPPRDMFDVVTVLSMLDPYTLRYVVPNIIGLMSHDGMLYIEAPNAASLSNRDDAWRKRDATSSGRDIERPMSVDLAGRHAFTIDDLHELADINALTVTEEIFYNYSRVHLSDVRSLFRHPLSGLLYSVMRRRRECIGISCRQNHMLRMFRQTMSEKLRRRQIADGKQHLEDEGVVLQSMVDYC